MMGTYCTFCRVAGPDIFDPPEHLPTCRYYPVEAKSRDKTILQLAEQIGKLSASLEIALNYQKSDNEKLEQQAEQIERLKEALDMLVKWIRKSTSPLPIETILTNAEELLAAPPQKDEWTKSQRL